MRPDANPESDQRDILDHSALRARLHQEIARVRRTGGFLSLASVELSNGPGDFQEASRHFRRHMRAHDVVGFGSAQQILLLMSDTDRSQARMAMERLVRNPPTPAPLAVRTSRIGVATVFGEVEGGLDAFLDGCTEASRRATPGAIVLSDTLKGHPRLLVIDDDETFARALAETVSEFGWDAEPCSDPYDGPQRAREPGYSALMVDLNMPRKTGLEILKESLARYPRRPVVLMSGESGNQDAIFEALTLGPVMFIRKPFPTAELQSALAMFRAMLPTGNRR